MANRCTNIAVVSSTDKPVLEQVVKEITENFECYSDIETGEGLCELEFGSAGPFPLEIMGGITAKHPQKNLYIQVLTYNLSEELVRHHVYEAGEWTDKPADKYQTKS